MKGIPREMHLDYHLKMTMRSQLDLKKEELMDATMVSMMRELLLVSMSDVSME